jgi:hypothetical protein
LRNSTLREETILKLDDIVIGTYDYDYPGADLDTSGAARFNAVEVTVRRTRDSPNGPVEMLFAGVLGEKQAGVIAMATAMADDRFAGLNLEQGGFPPLIPITIHIGLYMDQAANGNDEYSYDGGPQAGGDGVREATLYPWQIRKQTPRYPKDDSGEVETEGSGNFGLLDFGGRGVWGVANRIIEGISPEELEAEVGTSKLVYYDDDGYAVTYEISGEPGLKAGIGLALTERIGDVVGFFLHDDVWGDGARATFRNVGIRFGRIMEVDTRGKEKRLIIQPVAYTGSAVIVSADAPSTEGQIGRLVLVR